MPPVTKSLQTWKRPKRWLAFVLTFLGICAFLAIIPAGPEAVVPVDEELSATASPPEPSLLDSLRSSVGEVGANGHWTSLLPPLTAIMIAVFFRTIVGALVSAFLVGSFLSFGLNPLATVALGVNDFLFVPVFSRSSALIILFLFSLMGMVHVMSRSGGLSGLVALIGRVVKGRRQAKVAIGIGGLLLFFDHYSNAVVLGTTMQRLSDRWRISREKLAYLVDSTTAPVAGLALLSTWVAFEVFLLGEAGAKNGTGMTGYEMLLQMLPLRFYCIGTLLFLFLSSASGRDFGPMLRAERRAFHEGKLVDDSHERLGIQPSDTDIEEREVPARWSNAVFPILVLVVGIAVGIVALGLFRLSATGADFAWGRFADWRAAIGAAIFDPVGRDAARAMPALLLASVAAGVVAVLMPVFQRVFTFKEAVATYARGLPTMWMAVFILGMTWAMQEICANLGTAQYVMAMLGDGMPLWMTPLLAFFVAAAMSFATGSSWGSMAILVPILLPLAVSLGAMEAEHVGIYLLVAAATLDGAIFGDHCSPISDTTVLSSISTGCDHIAHVSTQFYYAMPVAVLSCVLGYGLVALGMPSWLYLVLAPIAIFGILRLGGGRSTETVTEE